MSAFSPSFEIRQMHVNAKRMPLCVGRFRKVAHANSNWEYYHDPLYGGIHALAKPGSGASDSCFGDVSYLRRCLQTGVIQSSSLTKYGRRLLRI